MSSSGSPRPSKKGRKGANNHSKEVSPPRRGQEKTLVRVIMAGNQATGKTSLLQKYTKGHFDHEMRATVGVDYQHVEIEPSIRLDLWDTAGQERFRSIVSQYFRKAHAVVLVYDITDRETFNALPTWVTQIKQVSGCKHGRETQLWDDILLVQNDLNDIMLVGNKVDCEESRRVTTEEGEKFAKEHEIFFIESSAKTGENVKEAFETVGRRAAEQRRAHSDIRSSGRTPNVDLEERTTSESQRRRCCHSG
eukprot:gb/GECG01004711.1/.p1 GENE.gb/GECG01004711.1/~~gb/GECG01004711.1/.p1  ORF type:complete len:250 (+),score=37.48 gb/GECG01004711.1/:1-750(+)